MNPARMQRRPLVQSTSRDAFRDFDPSTVDGRILAFIRDRGNATADEVEAALDIPHQTASAQISHLRAPRGDRPALIHATDIKRPTRRGRAAVAWALGPGPQLAPFVRPNVTGEQMELGVRE